MSQLTIKASQRDAITAAYEKRILLDARLGTNQPTKKA
jgi:hypothetical protein